MIYHINIETTNDPSVIFVDGKRRKCNIRKDGYYQIRIYRKLYLVHRLIAMQYIPNPLNLEQVNHKNGVRDDNRIENLEWVTRSENVKHGYRELRKTPKIGKRTITYEQAQEIRMKYSTGKYTLQQLATNYGFKYKFHIWAIVKNKTYKNPEVCL